MSRSSYIATAFLCALGLGVACTRSSPSPTSPSTSSITDADASNPDGSTLKATAPTPQSPINGIRLTLPGVTLVSVNSTAKFASVPLSYRFQVLNAGGTLVYESPLVAGGGTTTSHAVTANLTGDQTYQWQVRPEYQGVAGPWSSRASFIAPANDGYLIGNELYDPLINGKTIGTVHGPVTFIPGLGVRLESQLSYIHYVLPQTLTEGEFSILVTDMPANTEGDKTKLFAMGQGFEDIVTNDRRMTVEKRGDPPGIVAWRFITHGDQVDTEGAEREFVSFQASQHYFWQATWRNNRFNLLIREGGVNGSRIYEKGKNFVGRAYDPNPHVIYLGAPVGRSGEAGASVDHVTIRQVWVSSRPRPDFASQ
jgi:hypothetical protein